MRSRPHWFRHLRCVACHQRLGDEGDRLVCSACGIRFPVSDAGVPVMMTPEDRERFHLALGKEPATRMEREYGFRQRTDFGARLWKALAPPAPARTDPGAPPLTLPGEGLHLWLGGGGIPDTGSYINVDIGPFPGVELVATAGRLPLADGSSDRITCPALLEHVPDPRAIVDEAFRVLKPGGAIHAVVPFCHPYHAYPADYSRFSRNGLHELFSDFTERRVGIRSGPATTMATFATYYGKLLFPVHHPNALRRWFDRFVMGVVGWALAPLAGMDRWLNRLPDAHVLANHFWVTARKPGGGRDSEDVIRDRG